MLKFLGGVPEIQNLEVQQNFKSGEDSDVSKISKRLSKIEF